MGKAGAAGGNILYATVAQGASLDRVEESHRIHSLARESALIDGHCAGFQSKAHANVPKRDRSGNKAIADADSAAIVMQIWRRRGKRVA